MNSFPKGKVQTKNKVWNLFKGIKKNARVTAVKYLKYLSH